MLVAADNTTREAKNTTFATYLAYLVGAGIFTQAECQYMQTGHTHNAVDQRFSVLAAKLARAPVLEETHAME